MNDINKRSWVNFTIAACAVAAIVASVITSLMIHHFEYVPRAERTEVRFSLTQTASMLDRAKVFVKENPGSPDQITAVKEAGDNFTAGWEFYDNDKYEWALEKFKNVRRIIFEAFPPGEAPSIYYPFIPYPERL